MPRFVHVPIGSLGAVADLIRVYELRATTFGIDQNYGGPLALALMKTGRVAYGEDQEWWFDRQLGIITSIEFSPTCPRPLDEDGQRIIYPNAANIRLRPLLPPEYQGEE